MPSRPHQHLGYRATGHIKHGARHQFQLITSMYGIDNRLFLQPPMRNGVWCAVLVEDRVHARNVAPVGIITGKSTAIFSAPWRAGFSWRSNDRSLQRKCCYGRKAVPGLSTEREDRVGIADVDPVCL